MPSDRDWQGKISRRKALKYGTTGLVGSTALLAGCSGDGDDGDGDGGGTDGTGVQSDEYPDPVEERVDKRFTLANHRGTYEFDTASWNPYDPNQEMANFDPPGLAYDPFILHYQSVDEFDTVIANDWEKNDQALEVEISEEWTWHDGDQLTVNDWKTDWDLNFAISEVIDPENPPNAYIEEVEVVDDFFIRFHLRKDFSTSAVLINALANGPLFVKGDLGDPYTYREWADRIMDAEGTEAENIISDFQEWSPEEPVGNGPFEFTEITSNVMVAEVFDDHPNADDVLFTEYAFEQHENKHVAFQEGQVDGASVNFPAQPDVMENMPDHYVINGDFNHAWSVLFNFGDYGDHSPAENPSHHPITGDRRVRHAIAYALNRDEIQATVPPEYDPIDYPPSFLNQSTIDEGTIDIDGWNPYDQDQDVAAELMREAGYEREDGQWHDEDGEPAELLLMANSSTDVQRQGLDSIQHQLNEFGFDTQLDAVDEATYGERRFAGEHDILFDNHPIFSLRGIVWADFVWDWFHNLCHADFAGNDWEIPSPPGEPDSDETMTINVFDEIEQLNLTGDDEHMRRLSWWFNQVLPMYECVVGRDYGTIRADEWYVDGPDELIDNRVAEFNLLKKSNATLAPRKEQ